MSNKKTPIENIRDIISSSRKVCYDERGNSGSAICGEITPNKQRMLVYMNGEAYILSVEKVNK